jgi:hypothetical protein
LDLESASALASSEDLVGVGGTGDTTGMAVAQSTTITLSSLIAEPLIAAELITLTSATAALATVTRPMAEQGSADLLRLTFSQGHAPAPSAALITAEMRGDFPREGDQASVVVLMEASMVAAGATSIRTYPREVCRESKNGEEHHAAVNLSFGPT